MFNLQDTSSQYQRGNADADLKMKQAQEMKVMQEVYDLAVNNQYQKMVMAEETSPQGVRVRSQKREASVAQSEAEMWQSWNTTRDQKHEQAESAFAMFNTDPNQQTYSMAKDMLEGANPSIKLDDQYSPKAAQQIKAVQRAWLNNRAFKQKIAGMGIAAEHQEEFAQQQVGRDMEMQHQKATDAIDLMERNMDRVDWNTGLKDEAADERATASLQAGLQLAKRFRDQGHPDLAMAQLDLLEKQRHLETMAKARSGTNTLKGQKDMQDMSIKAYDQTVQNLEDNWQNTEELGFDKDFKAMEARGMSNTINSLHQKGSKFTSPDKLPAWTQARMVVWPERKQWIELPLDNNGMPVGGMTSDHIRGLVGKEYGTEGADPGRWTAEINDLDEAMQIYAQIMQEDYGLDVTQGMPGVMGAAGPAAPAPAQPY
jgi:hypothetical protein